MGLVIISVPSCSSTLLSFSSTRRAAPPFRTRCRLISLRRLTAHGSPICRLHNFNLKCFATNASVDSEHTATEDKVSDHLPAVPSGCPIPIVHIKSEILETDNLGSLTNVTSLLTTFLPVLSEEEQHALAASPAHPAGLYGFSSDIIVRQKNIFSFIPCAILTWAYALYASSLAGNLVEQLWNFAWPAAVALLHPSLLPVAIVSFFTKMTIALGGPLIGKYMDSFPRILAYNCLNIIQTAAQLLSAVMVIYALNKTTLTVLLQPWFSVLVVTQAIERLAGLALGVTQERDWVVLLAGSNRPVALAHANAMLNRIDLLCEIAGASIFGILLSKYDPVTCVKLCAVLMICTLPVLILLGQLTNKLSSGVLDRSKFPCKIVGNGMDALKLGWMEYKRQPVLPASVAYVLLYFNIALAPGALMTAFLTHRGISPSIIGGFSGLCAFMGVAATFISASLVKRVGILKAGAAGLIFQALLLMVAVVVFWSSSLCRQTPLLFFLSMIILSRLGHMSYDVVGTQILQTGIPASKANLIGTTEVSMASLAEFVMLGVAIIANDVSHFRCLAMLSLCSVVGAAWMFCRWLRNLSDEQRKLFSFDPQF